MLSDDRGISSRKLAAILKTSVLTSVGPFMSTSDTFLVLKVGKIIFRGVTTNQDLSDAICYSAFHNKNETIDRF